MYNCYAKLAKRETSDNLRSYLVKGLSKFDDSRNLKQTK